MQLDREMLQAYQDRWRTVAEFEAEEQRQTSFAERWRKLNSLVRLASALELHADRDHEQIQDVRNRWNLLRDIYLAKEQERSLWKTTRSVLSAVPTLRVGTRRMRRTRWGSEQLHSIGTG